MEIIGSPALGIQDLGSLVEARAREKPRFLHFARHHPLNPAALVVIWSPNFNLDQTPTSLSGTTDLVKRSFGAMNDQQD
jgi:hypothetical protein